MYYSLFFAFFDISLISFFSYILNVEINYLPKLKNKILFFKRTKKNLIAYFNYVFDCMPTWI